MAAADQETHVSAGVDAGMFGEILSYIYSGTLHVSLDKVQPLYQAADLLQLEYVRDTCSSYMAMNVEHSTCVDLYNFADVFSVDFVLRRCVEWIDINFAEFSFREEFCSLSVNQLIEIISHDELCVTEETTVWEAVVRWVQHSREDRLHHLPTILPHIRFNLLTSDDTAAILDHPLAREDLGSSAVIRNAVQKGNPNLKPRLGMTTEMAVLLNYPRSSVIKEFLFMNPQEGKYISCSYDLPYVRDMTVTSDNDIYILDTEESDEENQLSLFKYNHEQNVWEQAGVSSISKGPEDDNMYERGLYEVDGILYYTAVDPEEDRPLLQMRKYNPHTNQWQECTQLRLNTTLASFVVLSCGPNLYFLTDTEVYCYDPKQDRWFERTPPTLITDVSTAVAIGTEIFCSDFIFTKAMVYDTESDRWQELKGLPNLENFYVDYRTIFFVLENQLHVLLTCTSDSQEGIIYLVFVYDRSTDAWRDLNANLPDKTYEVRGSYSPVARIYLPYLKGT
ncbi:kelch repeat and BTB domain-containing protein 2-like [Branchiostoma floridae]|uniref:Kelch repeat and BTB domain-containing protein 2-like n=1 Tax=Branchiostoma floridae TaxID=7739 RepID=A0A9J7L4Y5_BRAFL|nr:kelch repeat and BTB domain-containing protein 2-like [Branchiostoma floridae]